MNRKDRLETACCAFILFWFVLAIMFLFVLPGGSARTVYYWFFTEPSFKALGVMK